jgi:hypothetical protein
MNSDYQAINDSKYSFAPPSVRSAILNAGRRKIVFVEGYDDKIIFEILYEENSDSIYFLDVSMEGFLSTTDRDDRIQRGCCGVKDLLKKFVSNLQDQKRFYGIVDRDLKEDSEVDSEKKLSCYDNRLFIFFERYTLENYFIEVQVLAKFLHAQSINHTRLAQITNNRAELERILQLIVEEILNCMMKIGAANLTIRFFDETAKFLEHSIPDAKIEERIKNRLIAKVGNEIDGTDVDSKFSEFHNSIICNNSVHKFASAKTYFSYQFNKTLKNRTGVEIQLNSHKTELERILKGFNLHSEFDELLRLLLQ